MSPPWHISIRVWNLLHRQSISSFPFRLVSKLEEDFSPTSSSVCLQHVSPDHYWTWLTSGTTLRLRLGDGFRICKYLHQPGGNYPWRVHSSMHSRHQILKYNSHHLDIDVSKCDSDLRPQVFPCIWLCFCLASFYIIPWRILEWMIL